MQDLLEQEIIRESRKRINRYFQKLRSVARARQAFEKRTGSPAARPKITEPSSWKFHRHFDPRYCCNHARFLAKGIWKSLQASKYVPTDALRISVAKASGGSRQIDLFSIPDAAVAKVFFKKINKRNQKIFADTSYAYQTGKSPLDAVSRISSYLRESRWFASQYDFRDFFGSISHGSVIKLLSKNGDFLTTNLERHLLLSVLSHPYKVSGISEVRDHGTPQGHCLYLFISNVAAHPLDKALALANGYPIRFADDSVVLTRNYQDATEIAQIFEDFSRTSGISINETKSIGIKIISSTGAELANIPYIDFLGYSISRDSVRLNEKAIYRFKSYCSKIIFRHLILYPRKLSLFNAKRVGRDFVDWDLVTAINELRRYIYSGHSHADVNSYLVSTDPSQSQFRPWRGFFAYFCLATEGAQFRALDGWLLSCLHRAYNFRRKVLQANGFKAPRKLSMDQIRKGTWYRFSAVPFDAKVPSPFLAWRVSRRLWLRHGLGDTGRFSRGYMYSD